MTNEDVTPSPPQPPAHPSRYRVKPPRASARGILAKVSKVEEGTTVTVSLPVKGFETASKKLGFTAKGGVG